MESTCQIFVRSLGTLVLAYGIVSVKCVVGYANDSQKHLAIGAFQESNLSEFRTLADVGDGQPKSKGKTSDLCIAGPGGGKRAHLLSLKDTAKPGDIVKLERGGSSLPVIYVGEESFPPEINEPPRSFFVYNYGGKVVYNTIPPRRSQAWMKTWLKEKGHKHLTREKVIDAFKWTLDSERKNHWLVARKSGKSFYPYIRMPSTTFAGSYEVYSSQFGRFIGFDHAELKGKAYDIEQDWKAAVILNEQCNLALAKPSQQTQKLLALTFGVTDGDSAGQISKLRANFAANLVQLKNAKIYYYPSNSLGNYYAGATPTEPNKFRVKESFFTEDCTKVWKSTSGRFGLFRASVLLHEGMHLTLSSDTDAHPGGKSPEFFEDELGKTPKSLGIPYELAIKNAYCYQFFAIWLSRHRQQSLTKSEADELWRFLTKQIVDHPYKPRKKMKISYKKIMKIVDPNQKDKALEDVIEVDLHHIPSECQLRAHLMYVAVRARFPGAYCAKVFHFGPEFPKKGTIRPLPKLSAQGRAVQNASDVRWHFHVAPVVKIEGTLSVLDPSLFLKPVAVSEWLKVQQIESSESKKQFHIPPTTKLRGDYPYIHSISAKFNSTEPKYVSANQYFEHSIGTSEAELENYLAN